MWTPEYYVRYLPLPPRVLAVTRPNDDGSFDIVISERLGDARRAEALRHELEHIRREHFYREGGVALKEAEAGSVVRLSSVGKGGDYESPWALLSEWLAGASAESVRRLLRCGGAVEPWNGKF